MLLLGNLMIGLANVLSSIYWLLNFILIGYVIISWVSADPYNPIVRVINGVSEPVMGWIRRYVPPIGMFDLSPLIALFALQLFYYVVIVSMSDMGHKWVFDWRKSSISSHVIVGG